MDELESFAFRAEIDGRRMVHTGDTTLCDDLLRIVEGADVIVAECSCEGVAVHLSPDGLEEMRRHAPGAQIVVTHLDGLPHPTDFAGMTVAEDLARYRL